VFVDIWFTWELGIVIPSSMEAKRVMHDVLDLMKAYSSDKFALIS
jgi:hypothetical protein